MLPKIQAIIAPLATPFAPALLLGNEMLQVMVLSGIPYYFALVCAFIAVAGLESSGALSCYMAVKAWKRKSWGAMWLAIIGAAVYTAIVFWGIQQMTEQRARVFSVMVFVTLVGYLAYALYQSFIEQDIYQEKQSEQKIELTRQQKQLINAQTRQMQWSASAQVGQAFAPRSEANERERSIEDLSKQLDVWAYLDEKGLRGPSEVANALGVAKSTAHKHIKSWQEKV